ncbi:F-box/FBD/LRR-repeat protein At5g56420-like [Mercurialis annua]|uniref:F-box/FBD/LRR-repeat protein At5g56420-like n=1 Tax=Mercurialis annua TaxID=3986 RepID=UPI00215EB673|nr:F-box/FBD/LRR-repeat protein At5g56420-like [Mercurialis annua]
MDRISTSIDDLPDSILHHIISLLPTNLAVQTSLVSKKWQDLWTFSSDLSFAVRLLNRNMMNSVERVLLLHNLSCLRSFTLTCLVDDDSYRVYSWISAIANRKIEKLSLDLFHIVSPIKLPACLFTCQSLTEFRLSMDYDLALPSSVKLSNLKSLTLQRVKFLDERAIQSLFSSPLLEYLFVDKCDWKNLKSVSICGPKLSSLSINDHVIINKKISDRIVGDPDGCQVFIFGKGLKSFTYRGEFVNDYNFYDASSIVEVHITAVQWDASDIYCSRLTNLLTGLSNVRDLRLSSQTLRVLNYDQRLISQLPIFNNLAGLTIDTASVEYNNKALQNIFENSPHLKTIEFIQGVSLGPEDDEDSGRSYSVSSSDLSNVKSIEIRHFEGSRWEEIYVVKSLLKRAPKLETMAISCWGNPSSLMLTKLHELLLDLPKTSKTCHLVFFDYDSYGRKINCQN